MMFQAVYRISWICLLLFSIGFCFPHRKGSGQQSSGSSYGSGSDYASDTGFSGFGLGSATSSVSYSSGGSAPRYAVAYFPGRRGPAGSGSVYSRGGRGGGFGSGSYTSGGSSDSSMDAGLAQMISDVMQMGPNRPSGQSHWNADQVPLGMIQNPPVYPSSHIIYTGSGYQRAQDSRTDSKYTTDLNIPVSGGPQDQPGTGPLRPQKTP